MFSGYCLFSHRSAVSLPLWPRCLWICWQIVPENIKLHEMREGLGVLQLAIRVFALLLMSIIPFLFVPLNTLLPAFNQDVPADTPTAQGIFVSAMGRGR